MPGDSKRCELLKGLASEPATTGRPLLPFLPVRGGLRASIYDNPCFPTATGHFSKNEISCELANSELGFFQ